MGRYLKTNKIKRRSGFDYYISKSIHFKRLKSLVFVWTASLFILFLIPIAFLVNSDSKISFNYNNNPDVLGQTTDEMSSVVFSIGNIFEEREKVIYFNQETGVDGIEIYGFKYQAFIDDGSISKNWRNVLISLENQGFGVVEEEEAATPGVESIVYKKDKTYCRVFRQDILEVESTEIEVSCFEDILRT